MTQEGSYIFFCLVVGAAFCIIFVINLNVTPKYLTDFISLENNTAVICNQNPIRLYRSRSNASSSQSCEPKGNVGFIKTHKTGSTTLRNILNKYGLSNNLSFVLSKDSSAGHVFRRLKGMPHSFILPPLGVEDGDYKNYIFNITNVHMRPDWKELRNLMNPSTVYITILRHPVDQWLSSFQYFHHTKLVKKFLNLEADPVKAFIKFRSKLGSAAGNICNQQMRDIEYSINSRSLEKPGYVEKKIEDYSNLFSLVLLTEYFDESLILLKRLLCWQLEDISYIKMREQPTPLQADSETRSEIERLNKADMMLYTHFNETFWQLIDAYGPQFEKDLKEFRDYLNFMQAECLGEKTVKIVAGNHENIRYGVKKKSENCRRFVAYTSSGDTMRKQKNQATSKS